MTEDVIDHLVGLALPVRERRPVTKTQTQASYAALFEPVDAGTFSLAERFGLALFVASLHRDEAARTFYADKLKAHAGDWVTIIEQAATSALTYGPYGTYPDGPLSAENKQGVNWVADEAVNRQLGRKLASALEHAHLLVFHPRDGAKNHLERLIKAGWEQPSIVTLSQLVAFLSYQLRIAHGLRVLAANPAHSVA